MPRSSHSASRASQVAGSGSAPVGLLGKFTAISRVEGRRSAASASRSSAQSAAGSSARPDTSAPVASVTVSIDW